MNPERPDTVLAYLGLGSNLGRRRHNIAEAIRLLEMDPEIEVLASASSYETAPMYVLDQPPFINTCIAVRTTKGAEPLLDVLLAVEASMGRERTVPNGPRVIDLDLLLYGPETFDTDRLSVPHPSMLERAFVLVPLAELAGELVLPHTGRTVAQHCAELTAQDLASVTAVGPPEGVGATADARRTGFGPGRARE